MDITLLEGAEADELTVAEADALMCALVEADAPDLPSVLEALQVADKPVFNERGIAKVVVMRPCISRGRKIRGLPPIYTPQMLSENAGVFTSWPMYFDHFPPELAEALKRKSRSVREMGGQILRSWWDPNYVGPDDTKYGYLKGAVLGEAWGTPLLRRTVDNNPHLFHTSINAWPKSARPGVHNGVKGMLVEGIRAEPQGSVDFVPRGGAGGRLLAEEDVQAMVSVAESFYAAAVPEKSLAEQLREMDVNALRDYLAENTPELLPAITRPAPAPSTGGGNGQSSGLTRDEVQEMLREEHDARERHLAERERQLEERTQGMMAEREAQRSLAEIAHKLIESADGIPPSWKADLKNRYAVLPSGPSPALLVEEQTDDKGETLSEEQVLRNRVADDLAHVRRLLEEARGRPRVTGEGGRTATAGGDGNRPQRKGTPRWREHLAELGVVESADKALAIHGEPLSDQGGEE